MKMVTADELEDHVETSSKVIRNSYFALIPVFNRRKEGNVEKNVIRIIHKSNISKLNPVLRTLLIENVRICCIVVETSGKHSVRILCASAPYIFSLICKANPKLEQILTNEKISSCLKVLQESDFESILTNVYQTTVFLQEGVKKYYPTICVSLIKDSILTSEKSLSHLFDLTLKAVQTAFDYIYEYVIPAFQYLYDLNCKLARVLFENFPQLISVCMKSSVILNIYLQKAIVVCFKSLKRTILLVTHILKGVYADSAVNDIFKQLHVILKLLSEHIHSSGAYNHIEKTFISLLQSSKPYVWKNFLKAFEMTKKWIAYSIPLLKNSLRYFLETVIPTLRTLVKNNRNFLLHLVNTITTFLYDNLDNIKTLFKRICCLLYRYVSYLSEIFEAILPYLIEFSTTAIIYLMSCLSSILENLTHITISLCTFLNSETSRQLMRYVFTRCIKMFKTVYQMISKARPYMVLIFWRFCSGMSKMIHELSPTLKAILYEMNSSMFYASNEIVAKSFLAVKHITPLLWYTAKTVVPPTIIAANEMFNSSKNCLIVVSPAVLKGLLTIRPELQECIIVLFSDGNKVCLEVATVSYSATCHMKDAAKTFSSNLPIVYKAAREVLTISTYAAIEVTTTSLSATSRMSNDLTKVRQVVGSSVILAEQEIMAAFEAANLEISYIFNNSKDKLGYDSDHIISRYLGKIISKFYTICERSLNNLNRKFKTTLYTVHEIAEDTMINLNDISELLLHICCYVIAVVYKFCTSTGLETSNTNALMTCLVSLFDNIFKFVSSINVSEIQCISEHIYEKLVVISAIVMQYARVTMSKLWKTSKSCLWTSWSKACQQAPVFWTMIENLASKLWNYIVDRIPGVWRAWKTLCYLMWEMICDFMPHVWNFSSSTVPVLWRSGREFVKAAWRLFISASGLLWDHSTSLTSDYWMLCVTYVPQVWFRSCDETKNSWDFACYATENCWNFTMEACLGSWNFLHNSIAKSWRKGLDLTKTAYTICSSAGSVLKKTVCFYYKSKNFFYVVLEMTPQINVRDFNSSSVATITNSDDSDDLGSKLVDSDDLNSKSNDSDDLDTKSDGLVNCFESLSETVIHSSEKSSVRKILKRYIFSRVSSFSKIDIGSVVNYETVMSSVVSKKFFIFTNHKEFKS